MRKLITVFTPLYNRKDLLLRLYESLTVQTCYCFEWLICDDCSADGSFELAQELARQEERFPIRVIRTEYNGGKHRAVNCGIAIADGFLFFIVDSDDALPQDAIEKILAWEKTISGNDSFAGLGFLKADLSRNPVGTSFSGQFCDCTTLERDDHTISGDKAEVIYTELFRRYPFPELEGEKFLTEAVVWDRIGHDGYQIRWINEIAYLCEYQQDGLSASWDKNLADNPDGYALWIRQKMNFRPCTGYARFEMVYGYYYTVNLFTKHSLKYACEKLDYPVVKAYLYLPVRKAKRIWGRLKGLFPGNEK